MIKMAFCCPYQIERLLPEIVLSENVPSYPCSWITNLTMALARYEEIDLHVITTSPNVPFDQKIIKNNITFYVLKTVLPRWITKYFKMTKHSTFFKPAWKMLKVLKTIRPDVAHGHGTEGPFSIPVVYSRFAHVISIQGIIAKVFLSDPNLRFRIIKEVEKHTIKKAQAINVKTRMSLEFTSVINPDCPKYFIEASIDPIFGSCPIPTFSRNIFFAGSIVRRKGIEEWLECFIKLKKNFIDLKGWVIGFGKEGYVKALKNSVEMHLAKNDIVFTGLFSHEEMASSFNKGGVFFLPSHIENSPNCVMEAMTAGLPVVATNVGAVEDIVDEGNSGFIVEPHDVSGMCGALTKLFNDEKLCMMFAECGRKISQRWKPEFIAQKHIEMYKDILSK